MLRAFARPYWKLVEDLNSIKYTEDHAKQNISIRGVAAKIMRISQELGEDRATGMARVHSAIYLGLRLHVFAPSLEMELSAYLEHIDEKAMGTH